MKTNREWILRRRPEGPCDVDDFEYRESEFVSPTLEPGHILVHNSVFLCAPTLRNWMDAPSNSLYPSIDLGAPVLATTAGRVLESTDERFPVGSRVTMIGHWQEYDVVNSAVWPVRAVPEGQDLIAAMGPMGMNALTAYFGVTAVGRPVAGETMLVSGAAGSTGSVAAQIGRILGCRVVGVAGGPEKCDWLINELGLDAAIDYRAANLVEQIYEKCPDGVDIFFDNVGGEILQAAVENINKFGRIVLCGQIAGYNESRPVQGPTNMMRFVYGSVRMQGFLLGDYEDELPKARTDLEKWINEGRLKHREDVRTGFENIPKIYGEIFTGTNEGTLLIVTDEDAYATN
jgi:NADPH-dependent curcumin reductase CurA